MEQAPRDVREPRDPLSVLRSVESTPPGDIEWALHCTRQQAAILLLSHGSTELTTLDALATAAGVTVQTAPDMPMTGMYLPTRGGWRIYVSDQLTPSDQLRAAVHQLKHLIDHPVRARSGPDGSAMPTSSSSPTASPTWCYNVGP